VRFKARSPRDPYPFIRFFALPCSEAEEKSHARSVED
jgi:hypothetical protein